MASKHRDIGLKFRHRSTPNTRRVTKDVGFGGGVPYIYMHMYTHDMQFTGLIRCMCFLLFMWFCGFGFLGAEVLVRV